MERSVLIQGVGLDASGAQRHKITMCKMSNESVADTLSMLLPALVDQEVVRVCFDVQLPYKTGGEIILII